MRTAFLSFVGAITLLAVAATAHAAWMGDYFPLVMGNSWTYLNQLPPHDLKSESVFEYLIYEGHPAVRVGEDPDNHMIAFNTGRVFSAYAEMDGGVLYDFTDDLVLGEFGDGAMFTLEGVEPDTMFIRVWSDIDATMRQIYEIPAQWTDMAVFVSYDRDYPANVHSLIMATNLPAGITPPTGAVTNIDFYHRDVGMVANRDVDAESGTQVEMYDLIDVQIGVADDPATPAAVTLAQNHPNPFNPATTVRFSLADAGPVTLTVHDAVGRLVRTLVRGTWRLSGDHEVCWRGRDDTGRAVPSGIFFCRLQAGDTVRTNRMTLVR